jgi:hypothetical protein
MRMERMEYRGEGGEERKGEEEEKAEQTCVKGSW